MGEERHVHLPRVCPRRTLPPLLVPEPEQDRGWPGAEQQRCRVRLRAVRPAGVLALVHRHLLDLADLPGGEAERDHPAPEADLGGQRRAELEDLGSRAGRELQVRAAELPGALRQPRGGGMEHGAFVCCKQGDEGRGRGESNRVSTRSEWDAYRCWW